MKKIYSFLFIIISFISYSQTKVNLSFINPCKNSIENVEFILVRYIDIATTYYSSEQDSIFEIEPGDYSIFVAIEKNEMIYEFGIDKSFKENRIYNDTIIIPRILRKKTAELHNPKDLGFYYCEKLCKGMITDYWPNGKIRMQGEFKNGYPKKEIKKFNMEGKLIETEIYKRKGIYKKSIKNN